MKLKGDSSYNCNYCNRRNHHERDCMLRKKEKKKEKVKDEAYSSMKIEEIHVKSKNLSLVEKNSNDEDGTYQIWSFGSDDDEMCRPTNGVMYAKHFGDHSKKKSMFEEFKKESGDESEEKEELIEVRFFVLTTSKSPMTEKVRDLLIFLNVPLNSYNAVLSYFDDSCSYLNDMLIYMSIDLEKNKAFIYEVMNNLEEKKTRIGNLDLKITNIMIDRDFLRMDNSLLVK